LYLYGIGREEWGLACLKMECLGANVERASRAFGLKYRATARHLRTLDSHSIAKVQSSISRSLINRVLY